MRSILYSSVFLILLSAFAAGCGTSSGLSDSGYAEKALVTRYLNLWVRSFHDQRQNKFIAPTYLKKHEISLDTITINTYAPVDFAIDYYNNGIVTGRIWGSGKNWEHRILFQVVSYKDRLYLYPSGHDEKFLVPWYSVSAYIDKSNGF